MKFWDVGSKLGDFFHLRGSVGFFGYLYCQFDAYVEFFVCLLVSDKQGWLGGVYNHFYPCFVVLINQDEGPKVRENVHAIQNDVPDGASYERVLLKGSKKFLSDVLGGLPVHTSILTFLVFNRGHGLVRVGCLVKTPRRLWVCQGFGKSTGLSVATVSGDEGGRSGRGEKGFAGVYKSFSPLPVPVRALKPAFIVPQGVYGKGPEGRECPSGPIGGLVFLLP